MGAYIHDLFIKGRHNNTMSIVEKLFSVVADRFCRTPCPKCCSKRSAWVEFAKVRPPPGVPGHRSGDYCYTVRRCISCCAYFKIYSSDQRVELCDGDFARDRTT